MCSGKMFGRNPRPADQLGAGGVGSSHSIEELRTLVACHTDR
jgi:hypothetical protein